MFIALGYILAPLDAPKEAGVVPRGTTPHGVYDEGCHDHFLTNEIVPSSCTTYTPLSVPTYSGRWGCRVRTCSTSVSSGLSVSTCVCIPATSFGLGASSRMLLCSRRFSLILRPSAEMV